MTVFTPVPAYDYISRRGKAGKEGRAKQLIFV